MLSALKVGREITLSIYIYIYLYTTLLEYMVRFEPGSFGLLAGFESTYCIMALLVVKNLFVFVGL